MARQSQVRRHAVEDLSKDPGHAAGPPAYMYLSPRELRFGHCDKPSTSCALSAPSYQHSGDLLASRLNIASFLAFALEAASQVAVETSKI